MSNFKNPKFRLTALPANKSKVTKSGFPKNYNRLTTLTGFPAFQSFAFTLLLPHNGAAQFLARALFIFVNV
jgi:hypothetical protein